MRIVKLASYPATNHSINSFYFQAAHIVKPIPQYSHEYTKQQMGWQRRNMGREKTQIWWKRIYVCVARNNQFNL